MKDERIKEEYRGYILVAALQNSKYTGRIWKEKKAVHDMQHISMNSLVENLKQHVDELLEIQAKKNGHSLDEARVIEGLRRFLPNLSDSQAAMLKAHYHAPNQTLTPTELAEAAGYENFSGVNLHYGAVGKFLYEYSPIELEKRDNGMPIYTCYLADAEPWKEDEKLWQWKLRPEVATAIKELGLDA